MKNQSANGQIKLLGERIRAIRRKAGLSQEDLAARADIHPTYLSGLERGKRNPSLLIFFSVASALRVTPADLLEPAKGDGSTRGGSVKRRGRR
ncbi:MAG: helix-turn-helix domain-containing protein [Terriglobales bacterium]